MLFGNSYTLTVLVVRIALEVEILSEREFVLLNNLVCKLTEDGSLSVAVS